MLIQSLHVILSFSRRAVAPGWRQEIGHYRVPADGIDMLLITFRKQRLHRYANH